MTDTILTYNIIAYTIIYYTGSLAVYCYWCSWAIPKESRACVAWLAIHIISLFHVSVQGDTYAHQEHL